MSGFIAMSREVFDHPLLRDGERFRAWFWMVSKACWKPTKFDVHGRIITLDRGQFSCSVRELAEAWGWSKSSVDRFLTRLKTETMIETESGTGRLVITICNYGKYQDAERDAGTDGGTPTGTPAGQQRDIKEPLNHSTSVEPKGSPPQAVDRTSEVFELWLAVAVPAGLPGFRAISDKRRTACRARLKTEGFDAIQQAIEKVPKSSFLTGVTSRDGWKADIDFFLKPDTITKILEGKYDDRAGNSTRYHGPINHDQQYWLDRVEAGLAAEPSGPSG
jgi:hypothetical protein